MRDETLELAGKEFDGDLASINSGSIERLLMVDDAEKKIESDTLDFDRIFFQAKTRRIELEKGSS